MCTIKFLIRQPWLYILAGFLILAMMIFSVFDAKSERHIVPFNQLQSYSGKVLESTLLSGRVQENSSVLIVEFNDGSKKKWQVSSNEMIPVGAQVQAYIYKDKVYDLVVNQQRLIEYQNVIAQNIERAEAAKATLTNPISILFVLFLFAAGIGIEIFKRRKPEAYQKYCVCAMDRIKMMEEEARLGS